MMNPVPNYNTVAHSGSMSYLPSINFRLLSITRYNERRNFITSHGHIAATNCFSFHFRHSSISYGVGVKIFHSQAEGCEGWWGRLSGTWRQLSQSQLTELRELVSLTLKGQELETHRDI